VKEKTQVFKTLEDKGKSLSDLTASSPARGKQRFVYMETKTKQNK
jgi:hypothetical protein